MARTQLSAGRHVWPISAAVIDDIGAVGETQRGEVILLQRLEPGAAAAIRGCWAS